LKLSSPTIWPGKPIPAVHTCEALDQSPALKWEGTPDGTKSLALICDDPDAPGGTWIHWVLYGIPATATALPENIDKTETVKSPVGVRQGLNDFERVGYNGPCPPPGKVHHYRFKLFALDVELNLPARPTSQQIEGAMKGHILGQGELVGTYKR